jgi:hypothetical protein
MKHLLYYIPNHFKALSALMVVTMIGAGFSAAQTTGASVTQKFKLQDLLEKRGKIQVGVNVPSSIEFDEPIVEHIIGRDDLLIDGLSKAKPNRIYFRAKENKGSSSIDITLEGGATALFTFEINPKISEGLRYVIQGRSDAGADETTATPTANNPAQTASTATASTATASSRPETKPKPQAAPVGGTGAAPAKAEPAAVEAATLDQTTPSEAPAAATAQVAPAPEAVAGAVSASRPTEVRAVKGSNKPVVLNPTVNAVRHFDPSQARPSDVAAYFTLKDSTDKGKVFELVIENHSGDAIDFEPNMNVYIYGYSSPTNTRPNLYTTLAPRFETRQRISIPSEGVFTQRMVFNGTFAEKTPFEYVANFVVIRDGQAVEYRRTVLTM